ncbi:MAG: hypothetical protein J6I97_05895 [Agathobacter sp.]|nr:hypothetical protein [Agathobacter sp.]
MPKVNKYNVYDNGKLIMKDVTHREIAKAIGCSTISIPQYIENGNKYAGRYIFEFSGVAEPDNAETTFAREWNAAVAPFKNVIWVKQGGKRLRVGGAHG